MITVRNMKAEGKVTLSEWFYSAARRPFLNVLFFLVCMQVLAYSIHVYRSYRTAKEVAALLASVLDLGVLQSNRLLVEKISALAVAYEFTGVILCDRDELLYSSGYWDVVTCNTKPILFSSVISVPLLNSQSKKAIFYYPYFKDYISSLLFALGPNLLLLLVVRHIRKILTRIRNDLIEPLTSSVRFIDSSSSEIGPINNFIVIEINELFNTYRSKVLELKNSAKTQAELDKQAEIGRITANLSHDMRAPLASIERLLALPKDSVIAQQAPTVREALFRLNAMIESLRHSEVESLVNVSRCVLNIDRILSDLTAKAAEYNITITTSVLYGSPDIPVLMDYPKFERAAINLVSNAIDFANSSVKVTVQVDNASLAFGISDDGPGVPDDFLPKLFQRGATFGKADGTGLGLAYVRQIMRGHGGDVTYRRENGLTVFECRLPNAVVPEGGNSLKNQLAIPNLGKVQDRKIVAVLFKPESLGRSLVVALNSHKSENFHFSSEYDGADVVATNDPDIALDAIEDGKEPLEFSSSLQEPAIIDRLKRRFHLV
jgi:signal transduction histidine kinase